MIRFNPTFASMFSLFLLHGCGCLSILMTDAPEEKNQATANLVEEHPSTRPLLATGLLSIREEQTKSKNGSSPDLDATTMTLLGPTWRGFKKKPLRGHLLASTTYLAGGSRYLILEDRDSASLALWDVLNDGDFTRLTLQDPEYLTATGGDRLLVYLPSKDLFQVFKIPSLELVNQAAPDRPVLVSHLGMGWGNPDHAVVISNDGHGAASAYRLDLNTLTSSTLRDVKGLRLQDRDKNLPKNRRLTGNMDGRFFVFSESWGDNTLLNLMEDNHPDLVRLGERGMATVTSNDLVFSRAGLACFPDGSAACIEFREDRIPSLCGAFYLAFSELDWKTKRCGFSIFDRRRQKPVANPNSTFDADRDNLDFAKDNTWFLSSFARVCVVTPYRISMLDLRALRPGFPKYDPLVICEPWQRAGVREAFSTQITTVPSLDGATFKLLWAPPKMAIDDSGLITWTPGPDDRGTHRVIAEISSQFGALFPQICVTVR